MKKIIAIVCMAWIALAGAWADNISAEDITMNAGETKTVSICLTNTESNLVSFQIDLTLPEGISINKAACSLSNRISDPDQELAIGKQGNNVYRIASTSFALTPIGGNSGTLLTLSLTDSADSDGGTATLSNILFVTDNSEEILMDDTNFTITVFSDKVKQTLSLENLPEMTYGDADYTLPETTEEGQTLTWESGNMDVVTVSGNMLTIKNAGTTTVTATQAGNSTYKFFRREFTVTVDKAPLTISANDCTKKVGSANPELTVSYEGFKYDDDMSVLTQQPTITTTATTSTPPGTYPITVSGAQAVNYDISYVEGTLTIEDAPTAIIFADDNVKAICVSQWDTNGDGELSETEAFLVTDLGTVFQNNTIVTSFDELQYFTGLTSISNYAFEGCNSLTSVTIPNSVTSIGYFAFNNCSSLTSVSIPNSVTNIGNNAFNGCGDLASIKVENGNTNYDSRDNCNAIIETSSNTLITGCMNTTIPNSVTNIGDYAFYGCSSLASVTIPNSVTSIGGFAFDGCDNLKSIEFHCKDVGNWFRRNEAIEEIIIDDEVESIRSSAFQRCTNLTSVTIGHNVTRIESGTFDGCTNLTSVTIPSSVTNIASNAFRNCNNLTSVTVGMETPVKISSSTFPNRTNATLYVPVGSKAAYEAALYWQDFFDIVEKTTDISQLDNVIYLDPQNVSTGSEAILSFKMKNIVPIHGFQFVLYLPEGITAATSSDGSILASLDATKLPEGDDHQLTTSIQDDGSILFLCDSQSDDNFATGDDIVLTLKVNVSEDMQEGDYPVNLKNINLSETDISNTYLTDLVQSKVTVNLGNSRIEFDETSTTLPTYADGTKRNVAMKRTLKAGKWSTIVLPFTLTKDKAEAAFGADVKLAEFTGFKTVYADNEDMYPKEITINFAAYTMTADNDMTGGKPFLIKTSTDIERFEADDVIMASSVIGVEETDEYGTIGMFTGSLVKTLVPANGLFISNNMFYYSTGETNIKAFRGWFELGAMLNLSADSGAKIAFQVDETPLSIEGLTRENAGNGAVYTISGQLVGKDVSQKDLPKGIYIINGKKRVVK